MCAMGWTPSVVKKDSIALLRRYSAFATREFTHHSFSSLIAESHRG